MLVNPLLPPDAGAPDVAGCRRLLGAVLAYDLPGDPPPAAEDTVAMLRPRWPSERAAFWTAEEHGEVVGLARLYLPGRENSHVGELHLAVHPAYRRRGAGTWLLTDAVRVLLAERRTILVADVAEGTDGMRFVHARGLRVELREARSLLDLMSVNGPRLDALAEEEHPSYRLAAWVDGAPDDLLPSYGLAKRAMRDAPVGTLGVEPTEWDSTLVRQQEESDRRAGREYRVVAALHEPTGEVAGLTEVTISRWTPRRACQQDTTVVPAHRGHGLTVWMRAEMVRWLRAERADVTEIVTWTAEEDLRMRQVDEGFGYKLDRWWARCHADVPTLARRLGIQN
ncbi:MAG TPA: GNAT family N-acetyltransferase [Mycobacteriales bacterium]|nr:GNAT family N-acetyltransferase [Mycobacteriales bacterium]